MPQWIIHPSNIFWRTGGDLVWNLLGLSYSLSEMYHKEKRLIPFRRYSANVLHCSEWWPVPIKWHPFEEKKNNLAIFNALHHSLSFSICLSLSLSLPLAASIRLSLLVSWQIQTQGAVTRLPYLLKMTSLQITDRLWFLGVSSEACVRVTDDMLTGGWCASSQAGLHALYIHLHHLTLRDDPSAQTARWQSHLRGGGVSHTAAHGGWKSTEIVLPALVYSACSMSASFACCVRGWGERWVRWESALFLGNGFTTGN